MPYLETPSELADFLADSIGIYGGHEDGEKKQCRVCFVFEMSARIRAAVENEQKLNPAAVVSFTIGSCKHEWVYSQSTCGNYYSCRKCGQKP